MKKTMPGHSIKNYLRACGRLAKKLHSQRVDTVYVLDAVAYNLFKKAQYNNNCLRHLLMLPDVRKLA